MTENETKIFAKIFVLMQGMSRFTGAAAEKTRRAGFEGKSTRDDMKEQEEAGMECILELEKYRAIGTAKDCAVYKRIAEKELANACLSLRIIDELEEYKAIGTVGECREAMERQKERKPELWGDGCDKDGNIIYDMYDCPNCGTTYEIEYEEHGYCPNCGQRILWECDGKGTSGKESGNERKSIQGKAHPCIQ